MNVFNPAISVSFPYNKRYFVDANGNIWDNKSCKQRYPNRYHSFGYPQFVLREPTKQWKLHRIVAHSFLSNPDQLRDLDHIDGDILNNRIENLRWCSHSNNLGNRPGWKKRTSLPKNVYRIGRRFRVQIMKDYKTKYFGSFETVEAAHEVAISARHSLFGEFAHM